MTALDVECGLCGCEVDEHARTIATDHGGSITLRIACARCVRSGRAPGGLDVVLRQKIAAALREARTRGAS